MSTSDEPMLPSDASVEDDDSGAFQPPASTNSLLPHSLANMPPNDGPSANPHDASMSVYDYETVDESTIGGLGESTYTYDYVSASDTENEDGNRSLVSYRSDEDDVTVDENEEDGEEEAMLNDAAAASDDDMQQDPGASILNRSNDKEETVRMGNKRSIVDDDGIDQSLFIAPVQKKQVSFHDLEEGATADDNIQRGNSSDMMSEDEISEEGEYNDVVEEEEEEEEADLYDDHTIEDGDADAAPVSSSSLYSVAESTIVEIVDDDEDLGLETVQEESVNDEDTVDVETVSESEEQPTSSNFGDSASYDEETIEYVGHSTQSLRQDDQDPPAGSMSPRSANDESTAQHNSMLDSDDDFIQEMDDSITDGPTLEFSSHENTVPRNEPVTDDEGDFLTEESDAADTASPRPLKRTVSAAGSAAGSEIVGSNRTLENNAAASNDQSNSRRSASRQVTFNEAKNQEHENVYHEGDRHKMDRNGGQRLDPPLTSSDPRGHDEQDEYDDHGDANDDDRSNDGNSDGGRGVAGNGTEEEIVFQRSGPESGLFDDDIMDSDIEGDSFTSPVDPNRRKPQPYGFSAFNDNDESSSTPAENIPPQHQQQPYQQHHSSTIPSMNDRSVGDDDGRSRGSSSASASTSSNRRRNQHRDDESNDEYAARTMLPSPMLDDSDSQSQPPESAGSINNARSLGGGILSAAPEGDEEEEIVFQADVETGNSRSASSRSKMPTPVTTITADMDSSDYYDEETDEDEDRKERRKYLVPILFCAVFLIAVIVVLTVIFATADNNNTTRSASVLLTPQPTEVPSFSPTSPQPVAPVAVTTSAPSQSPVATLQPTGVPTEPPSVAPEQQASESPTAPLVPSNDGCPNAVGPLFPNTGGITGTIEGSNVNLDAPVPCGDVNSNDAGVWYFIEGIGGEMLAHTCRSTDFDSKITIYTGPCSELRCVEGNDDFCGNGGSAVSWLSNVGQIYSIYVHGNVEEQQSGNFELAIVSRLNDECGTALGPFPVNTGNDVSGSTALALPDPEVTCGVDGVSAGDSRGVWHLVRGTGGDITASTCVESSFESRITVLTGEECSSLSCIPANFNSCTITWSTVLFQDYYVVVHGPNQNEFGTFGLALTSTPSPDNDVCEDGLGPIPLDGRSVVSGTTVNATVESGIGSCGVSVLGPGVWYYVIGDGSNVTASLCDDSGLSTFDTRISVYDGDCSASAGGLGNLNCIGGNDNACGIQASYTWPSVEGQRYAVLVHGRFGETGSFDLRVMSKNNEIPKGADGFLNQRQ